MEHSSDMPSAVQPSPVAHPLRSARKMSHPTSMGWFEHLLETRPMAFWSGVWVSVFLIGVVAFGSLLSPNAAERRSVSAIALGSDSGVATQPLEDRGKVPLWLFGAIALTCTAGSIAVSRQLQPRANPSPLPRRRVQRSRSVPSKSKPLPHSRKVSKRVARQPKRLRPYSSEESMLVGMSPAQPAIAPTSSLPEKHEASSRRSASHPYPVQPPQPPVKSGPNTPAGVSFVVSKKSSSTTYRSAPARSGAGGSDAPPSIQPAEVSIVPADQVHPLDWDQPRLADALDLRKRQSIQSLL